MLSVRNRLFLSSSEKAGSENSIVTKSVTALAIGLVSIATSLPMSATETATAETVITITEANAETNAQTNVERQHHSSSFQQLALNQIHTQHELNKQNLSPKEILEQEKNLFKQDKLEFTKILERSWKPSIEFAGNGDYVSAVDRMREMQELQHTMLKNSDFHQQTDTFINQLWASFERFNLKRFYKILPDEQGEWRKLTVVGHRSDDRYKYGPNSSEIGATTKPQALGDFSVEVRAKKVENQTLGTSFLLETDIDMGVGSIDWGSVTNATKETFKIMADGDARFNSTQNKYNHANLYREKVRAMNQQLDESDVEILAPLWASFPQMWELLSQIAKVEDVVVSNIENKPYKQLQTSLSIQPDKMKKHYPELAKFLKKMGPLFNFKLDLMADEGRYFHAEMDSKSLTSTFEAYVKDGQILPLSRSGEVVLNVPNKKQDEAWHFVAVADAELEILGVMASMNNIKTKMSYTTRADGASLLTQTNELPVLDVSGRAMGIVPTSVIDFFMPGNIESVMSEFLAVVFNGNEGNGIVMDVNYQQATQDKVATVKTDFSFVGLDNIFVRIGMGIVNDRIIPEDNVSEDIRKLWFDTQQAFAHDLESFANTVL